MKNRYPEPICDGNPTRTTRIAAAAIWIGSAALGIAFYASIILWVLK